MSGENVEGRVMVLEERMSHHERHDDERLTRVDKHMETMVSMMTNLSKEVREGFSRVHQLREETESKLRHAINNAAGNAQGAVTQLRQHSDEKIEAVETKVGTVADSVAKLEAGNSSKVISFLGAVVVILLGICGFFIVPYFSHPPATTEAHK